jgi:carbonic anhydrase
MSCPTATAPIDINISNKRGLCDLKCSFKFYYNNSTCVATNRDDYISISYDKSSKPPVTYNATGYDVKEIRLYTPSLHTYKNNKTDAELIIIHTSNTGEKPLLVCIPVRQNNTTSESSLFFNTLIETVASNANKDGETTTVNLNEFNLNTFVPMKPYFSYTATEPYQPCSEIVDYIVYNVIECSLDINEDILTKLQEIIKQNNYNAQTSTNINLFYNEKGPFSDNSGELYLDCQPVGSSEDTTSVVFESNSQSSSNYNWNDFVSQYSHIIIFLVFFIILVCVKYFMSKTISKNIINFNIKK